MEQKQDLSQENFQLKQQVAELKQKNEELKKTLSRSEIEESFKTFQQTVGKLRVQSRAAERDASAQRALLRDAQEENKRIEEGRTEQKAYIAKLEAEKTEYERELKRLKIVEDRGFGRNLAALLETVDAQEDEKEHLDDNKEWEEKTIAHFKKGHTKHKQSSWHPTKSFWEFDKPDADANANANANADVNADEKTTLVNMIKHSLSLTPDHSGNRTHQVILERFGINTREKFGAEKVSISDIEQQILQKSKNFATYINADHLVEELVVKDFLAAHKERRPWRLSKSFWDGKDNVSLEQIIKHSLSLDPGYTGAQTHQIILDRYGVNIKDTFKSNEKDIAEIKQSVIEGFRGLHEEFTVAQRL